MSGGHWDRLGFRIQEMADNTQACLHLLADIEHCLDYGICGDSCYECAKVQVIAALEAFFDGPYDYEKAKAIIRPEDWRSGVMCPECEARYRGEVEKDA